MRIRRLAAIGGTAVLVAASTLLAAGPALAEETVGDITFFEESDFGVETSSYPAETWFFGDDSDGPSAGTATFGPNGLAINDGSGTAGVVQILGQDIDTPASAAELIDLLDDALVYEDDDAPGAGDWTFQLPLYADTGAEFTTLRPADPGTVDTSIEWITSQDIVGSGGPEYPAGSIAPLGDLLDAIYDNGTPEILAYGLWFGPGDSPVIRAISLDDDESWDAFLAVPTRSISPAELTVSETGTTGITFSGTGWIPGTELYLYVENCETGDQIFGDGDAAVVDEDGNVSITLLFDPELEPGEYCVEDFDDDEFLYGGGVFPGDFFAFEVTADPLPATGADPLRGMIAATGLLLAGATALVLVSLRRKARMGL